MWIGQTFDTGISWPIPVSCNRIVKAKTIAYRECPNNNHNKQSPEKAHIHRFMRFISPLLILSLLWGLSVSVLAEDKYPAVEVVEPYIDLRTGPGRGYPIFYIGERGEWIEVIKRRTDWFKVRTERDKVGWVHVEDLEKTVKASGDYVSFKQETYEGYLERTWEVGFLGGAHDTRYDLLSVYGAYHFTNNLSLELHYQDMLVGDGSKQAYSISLLNEPFTLYRVTPYFGVGGGQVKITETDFDTNQETDTNDQTVHVAAGLRTYVTRSFLFRAGYRRTIELTSKDDNNETEEWKIGFAVFF